ncbi:nuclear transport factor 2 family protein [Novosphingobium album (ex Hu et al. 2023)]|uniref:Nuclear transport factor 2 family protein n=1 Tax=Novosphingobium album (ex Hu et al. 2023) TaxID=2930093 RepID=A0ABT0B206_9SPHN|nr:nuclear transport factor 2 family protein [Novosphingobium album (ex Hu et al. 2023)]MCJ2178951.1 nuclear transport factor 2 family protein [Novosphingobium album (ex Hu et al. 2023)]
MTESNKDVALAFITAMDKGDTEAAARCLDPEAVTIAKGFGKLSGERRYGTIVGTIGAFRELMPEGMNPVIHSVTSENDRVVVEFEGNAVLANGTPYCNQYCMVFTLREGRIVSVNEYYCTILADAAIGPLLEARAEALPWS